MAAQKWSRGELERLVVARLGSKECEGADAFLDLRIKVTPELLQSMLGGHWIAADGKASRFDGVTIGDDGYAEPIMVRKR